MEEENIKVNSAPKFEEFTSPFDNEKSFGVRIDNYMQENKVDARKICFIQEVYTDEHNTLEQMIMYIAGDIRARNRLRSEINPNLTILKRVWELDEDLKRIKE